MKQNSLAFYRSGWFYLLLLLLAGNFWYWHQGGYRWLEQLNRERLYQTLPLDNSGTQVKRLYTQFTPDNIVQLKGLFNQYPDVPVVMIGDVEQSLLAELDSALQSQSRSAAVTIATDKQISVPAIVSLDADGTIPVIDWIRFPQPTDMEFLEYQYLTLVPVLRQPEGGIPLFWFENDKIYYSLLGEILRQLTRDNFKAFSQGWELKLILEEQEMPLGHTAQLFSDATASGGETLQAFMSQPPSQKPGLIVLDNRSQADATILTRSISRLIERNYLYQSSLAKLAEWGFFAIGLIIVWFSRRQGWKRQTLQLAIYLLLAWVGQYILFTQLQWMSVFPVTVSLLVSWAVVQAFQFESRQFEQLYRRHQLLLGDALPVFYQAQELEKIKQLLASNEADPWLADKVFDIALQAEASNNRPLAKNLLSWIQHSGLDHQASADKLNELLLPEEEDSLEGTMVIEPGQTSPTQALSHHYQVDHFGRYQVEGILGKGAMGIVYQGVDPKINRHVAIKTLQLNESDDEAHTREIRERFFREAETAGNLSHANIVTIYDVGEEGNLGYIAMDLLTGAPLSEFVKPGNRLPIPLVYQLMVQITDALDYAHRQNVVHRDIKPGNIIFDDEVQRVTVTDFGIAYMADNSKTRTGTIVGSPYYMSPEQVMGQTVDGRSDIFSLGVTFYQLLTGELPFKGDSIASVAYHITKSKHTVVRQIDSKLPASAVRISNKAMQKDTAKRYQSMNEFKQALINALKRDFKKAPIV